MLGKGINLCFLLLSIFYAFESCYGIRCEHYTDRPNDQHACNASQFQNGTCDMEVECEETFSPNHKHCFAAWKNESGTVTVVKKGCSSKNKDCMGKNECYATREPTIDVYHCCCESDLCNSQFSFIASLDDPVVPTREPNNTQSDPLLLFAYILAPISGICLLIAVGYFFYRKNKKVYDDMDTASVGTPSSGMTTSSLGTNVTSIPKREINLPQLIEMKARGRFGCVWKAQLQDRFVAVKIFYLQDKQSWQNEQEIFNTQLISNHPNILKYIAAASRGVGVETELWLITEFHELGSLADFLKGNVVSIADGLRFMESMATGLAFLHEDVLCSNKSGANGYKPAIAHRDFKSKNVLITNKRTAVIADFGLAVKFVPGESPGETHGQVGTRRYMAPEILEGAINFQRDAFLRIDMYAFALVLWEIVTRCYDAPGGAASIYLMPYEEELGNQPTIEAMQENVVDRKLRPQIKHEWRQHAVIGPVCETIEECWDHDVEARLSAGCVEERMRNLKRKVISPPEIPIQANQLNGGPAQIEIPSSDVETQNQINAQRNQLNYTEGSRLISPMPNGHEASDSPFVNLHPESALLSSYERESNV